VADPSGLFIFVESSRGSIEFWAQGARDELKKWVDTVRDPGAKAGELNDYDFQVRDNPNLDEVAIGQAYMFSKMLEEFKELCPCLDYMVGKGGKVDPAIITVGARAGAEVTDKEKTDRLKKFCCCWKDHQYGCNLMMATANSYPGYEIQGKAGGEASDSHQYGARRLTHGVDRSNKEGASAFAHEFLHKMTLKGYPGSNALGHHRAGLHDAENLIRREMKHGVRPGTGGDGKNEQQLRGALGQKPYGKYLLKILDADPLRCRERFHELF